MNKIIAYKDHNNEYFDHEIENGIPIKSKSEDALNIMRHDMAHILAEAVTSLFPNAKPTIGPFIKNGFYYDFDMENTLSDEDLSKIEAQMKKILSEGRDFKKRSVSKEDALEIFKDNQYKVELINNLDNSAEINLYDQKNFTDLCKGPHHSSTTEYDANFKITSVSGAYWRGISTNKMLQRIYATAFYSEKELNKYLKNLEEAKERNHRRLGTDMGLFLLTDLSAGNVFWKEKGLTLYQNIEKYIRSEQQKLNYLEVKTPELVSNELWIKSGHWDNFKENMFTSETDNKTFALKPMNCPCHIVLFNSQLITYKDLPLRYSEFGKCHRYEPSGALNGLFRVRGFTQDDAHIFCTGDQIYDVCNETALLIERVYKRFGFEKIKYNISTKPEKSIGTKENWDNAENQLKKVLSDNNKEFNILEGEGAFYGPKIEFTLEDSLGREWQCGTIQIDFNLPERLGAKYKDTNDKNQTPIMIHRAVVGSLERFIAIILENTNGWVPLFITPIQLAILPVSEKFIEYCNELNQHLKEAGIRLSLIHI